MPFLPGQRWISETEPELGLGTVLSVGKERILMSFPASGEQRQYAIDQAPLRRVAFRVGETITTRDGNVHSVAAVEEQEGLWLYRTLEGPSVPESDLRDSLSFDSPEQRLTNGHGDPNRAFELRQAALNHQYHRRRSPVRGFVGGRMDLIPHQLYITREVAGRHAPRVLLADEVGLGKTVEACLIIHRLLETGRASRVLVVVPEPLLHQWFVELLRRFNLWFHIFDTERVQAIEAGDPNANPFLENQVVLCALSLLLDPRRTREAMEAGWDLLVVDEAHHLAWSPQQASPEYSAIEALSRRSDGLLLLTATPEQLGLEGHYARLRLLDPERYPDYAGFQEESQHFGEVAAVANKLVRGSKLTPSDLRKLQGFVGAPSAKSQARLDAAATGDAQSREALVADLLDRHGTGRVMFRNTRAAIKGFPSRRPKPAPLPPPADSGALLDALAAEFESDLLPTSSASRGGPVPTEPDLSLSHDPRLDWLAGILRKLGDRKILLIARSRAKVLAIDAALRMRLTVKTALFHEDLELIQRDRNAAWFAEPNGARILLASEIGSEGRNFQFAHHLILFDLPLDPELVEQRIGRLDRIGQTADIQIHVPYLLNSPQEVLFRWFHEGLDAFSRNLVAGRELLEQFGAEVRDLALDFHETHASRRTELDSLVDRTRDARQKLEHRLEQGRDRLLELNSHRPGPAREIAEAISNLDQDSNLEEFLLQVWDHYGVPVEDLGPRLFRIGADGVFTDAFPGLPSQGMAATLDRRTALSREDLTFLTWDHPMVTGALDLLLGTPDGSTACVAWATAPRRDLWLEMVHVVECVAPPKMHADRFLPATPIRVIVDVQGGDITARASAALKDARLRDSPVHTWLDKPAVRAILPKLAAAARRHAETKSGPVVAEAIAALDRQLGHELERLRALAAINPAVRPTEVAALEDQRRQLRQSVEAARLRLDSIRLIVLGDL